MNQLITSQDNAHFKRWRSLQESRGIKKHGQFLASGEKILTDLKGRHSENSELLVPEGLDAPSDYLGKIYRLRKELFRDLDEFGTNCPLLVGPLPNIANWDPKADSSGLHIICPLGDPANLGALVRTATALECSSIVLTREAAQVFLPKVIRSSVGTVFKAPLKLGPNLNEALILQLDNAYALDLGGENINNFTWPEKAYLVIGEEGPGLPEHNLKKLTIPISNKVESLNATIATSLAINSYNQTHPSSSINN